MIARRTDVVFSMQSCQHLPCNEAKVEYLESSFEAHRLVTEEAVECLPRHESMRLLRSSRVLGCKPVCSFASTVLLNVRDGKVLKTFTGTRDEEWFYLVSWNVESHFGEILDTITALQARPNKESMRLLASQIRTLSTELLRVYEQCNPLVFYHQLRPYLQGLHGIKCELDDGKVIPLEDMHGASAAQSPLIRMLDIVFGLHHLASTPERAYLREMWDYMLEEDRTRLQQLEAAFPDVSQVPGFKEAREALLAFRNHHLLIVKKYIVEPANDARAKGTGGTDALQFVTRIRDMTRGRPK